MICEEIIGKSGCKEFKSIVEEIYKDNTYYRGTDASVEHLLIQGPSAFHKHAEVYPYLIRDGNDIVGRFALIRDKYLQEYVQVSYFETLHVQANLLDLIRAEARKRFPDCTNLVVGLSGHLNYGAGFLLNSFDQAPLFGMPYTMPYYPEYFTSLNERKMFSFRFNTDDYIRWAESYSKQVKALPGLEVRFMNKAQIKEEIKIYTYLNNKIFLKHPYWANREIEEDLELFYPFRFLLRNENLIFAELNGKAVGFMLWYPDFNELVSSHRDLNTWDLIKFKTGKKFKGVRLSEIGVMPELQKSPISFFLYMKSISTLQKYGYQYCEVSFIFEENKASIAMGMRRIQYITGIQPQPHRIFAVYDGKL
jgi:hypothetical protein